MPCVCACVCACVYACACAHVRAFASMSAPDIKGNVCYIVSFDAAIWLLKKNMATVMERKRENYIYDDNMPNNATPSNQPLPLEHQSKIPPTLSPPPSTTATAKPITNPELQSFAVIRQTGKTQPPHQNLRGEA